MLTETFWYDPPASALHVLDYGYRSPGRGWNPTPRPEGTEVTDRPTDPEILDEVEDLVAEFIELATAVWGSVPDLGEGHSVPGLEHLDLSGCEVVDLEALAVIPTPWVLALNADQWREMWDSGYDPANLAIAYLDGHTGQADVREWRRRLMGNGAPMG